MGIQGLLPLLKSIMVPIHVKELEGCSVAVDTYSWLHKGALSCSKELCNGVPTTRHIEYCMHRVNLLRHYGVKPFLVFDGGLLPMKIEQENKRARSRKENLARAIEHESNGNSAAAYECYQKAVDITPSMAHELIQVLKQENISYVVAPYEADAQMTFLAVSKQVAAVITEDSDLIPFGCPRIIFKMDKFGQGVEFQYSKLQQNRELSFAGFTKQMILEMCILSGCDYLQSLPGMGLKTAHALIKKFRAYDKVIKHLKYTSGSVPPTYEELFRKAILTFQHQRVYDPISEAIVHLYDISNVADDELEFLGPSIPQHVARGIAEGDLDPFTKVPFQGRDVSAMVIEKTQYLKLFKPKGEKKKLDLPAQKNVLTKYFCSASLETKRDFKAPRATSNQSSPVDNLSQSFSEQDSEEALADMSHCQLSQPHEDEDGFTREIPEATESMESGALDEVGRPGVSLLQQSRLPIHKPCVSLKEHQPKSPIDRVDEKTRKEDKKHIVRSSYFKHQLVNETDRDKERNNPVGSDPTSVGETLCVKGIIIEKKTYPDDKGENVGVNSIEEKTRTDNREVIVRSSYVRHHAAKETNRHNGKENILVKCDLPISLGETDFRKRVITKGKISLDDVKQKVGVNGIDEKARRENRKVIIRSSYFKPQSANDIDKDDEKENIPVESDHPLSLGETDFLKGRVIKRKTFLDSTVENESSKQKRTHVEGSLVDDGDRAPGLDKSFMGSEEKFGADISHLGRYSDIAEKSLERFVSVISSFRFTGSGSRASGLRAPLKDVHNTCTDSRSTAVPDFSQFAYVAKNKMPMIPTRRS
ncbi:exonuclease 1 isoform X1 [Rhodamnia argentea]|uniref:Exonuclease 1 isoform X1 n=1 Tax=Rhodamnia argentea TaxID=178133 RepID=A0ABM3HYH8_9MYRT|nr:exonuclease 1 isoform X1 [Rhodamnia argentea]XP_048141655.1 exonuclease 1 isoform X1 [Rhodamnia argentea]